MTDKKWLMLNFTLPKEPSRIRVSIWRKLKKSGSVSVGQSMWLLPVSERNLSIFKEIAKKITQNKGHAYVGEVNFVDEESSEDMVNLFHQARDSEYKEFLEKCQDFFREIEKETAKENFSYAELEENEEEYNKLVEWLHKIALRDFFNAPLKNQAEQKLEECKKILDEFSNKVYQSNEEN